MQTVFVKLEELKLKISKLLFLYKNVEEENKSLKNRVRTLEEELNEKISSFSEIVDNEELKIRIEESINEIDEVIKILS